MDNAARAKTAKTLTIIGLVIIVLLTLTKLVPATNIAGCSVLVGIAFFFIVEAVAKTPDAESGLRFRTFFCGLKKAGRDSLDAAAGSDRHRNAYRWQVALRRRVCRPCAGADKLHAVI